MTLGQVGAITSIPVELFMAGDLLFYSMALGKENFQGWWCSYCRLRKTEWQLHGHQRGELWTIETLRQQAENVVTNDLLNSRNTWQHGGGG